MPPLVLAAIAANGGLVRAFHAAGGPLFATAAAGYLVLIYPVAIAVGAAQADLAPTSRVSDSADRGDRGPRRR